MNADKTKSDEDQRLGAIGDALDALVDEHGPMLVAAAIQAFALGNMEYMQAALRVSLIARDVIQQKRRQEANTCQCPECRAQRGQA